MPATPSSDSSKPEAMLQSLLEELDRASTHEGLQLLTRFKDEEDTISDGLHASADKNLRKTIFEPEKGRRPAITIPIRGISPGCRRLMDFITEQTDIARYLSKPDVGELWRLLEDGDAPESAAALCALCNHILAQGGQASFKELRRLRLCGRSSKKVAPVKIRPDELKTTVTAWKHSYAGEHHEHLSKQIQEMKAATNTAYSNVLPIIQSSGTGKSRLAYEVSGKIVTLPLNVHRPADGGADFVYPEPDSEVADYLAGIEDKIHHNDAMKQWHLAFLCSLMQAAATEITQMGPKKTYARYEHLASAWRAHLAEEGVVQSGTGTRVMRKTQMYRDVVVVRPRSNFALQLAVLEFSCLFQCARQLFVQYQGSSEAGGLQEQCQTQGLKLLLDVIKSRVHRGVTAPPILLLLTIDGVDSLSTVAVHRLDTFPEATTACEVFLSALQDLGPSNPFFILTLSTHLPLDKNAQTRFHISSTCDIGYEAVRQTPWTELPFDIRSAEQAMFVPGTVTLDEVAQPAFMVRFGRALFCTRWDGAEEGSAVRTEILDFAFIKLAHETPEALAVKVRENKTEGVPEATKLAAVSMRVLLDFDFARQSTRDILRTMVSQNMHIAFTVPYHRDYMRIGAPSEPVLAHASAVLMNECPRLLNAPAILVSALQQGIVEKRNRGGLVARLLMILAHDRAHRLRNTTSATVVPKANWSAKVPVTDLLQALFAEHHHAAILGATPEDSMLSDASLSLREAFEGAFVRYTHFVRLSATDTVDSHVGAAGLARGMAFQCSSARCDYDLAIPILMEDGTLHESLVSFILIQIGDRRAVGRCVEIKADESTFAASNDFPYIVVAMELGFGSNPSTLPSKIEVSGAKDRTPPCYTGQLKSTACAKHPAYKIRATGCSSQVYGVIPEDDDAHYASLLEPWTNPPECSHTYRTILDSVRRTKPGWKNDPDFE